MSLVLSYIFSIYSPLIAEKAIAMSFLDADMDAELEEMEKEEEGMYINMILSVE